jgi:hemoglobin
VISKRGFSGLAAVALAVLAIAVPALADQHSDKSLYQRLGGYDAVAAVTDDLVVRLIGDPTLGRFLDGMSNDSKAKLRQHFVDFLCSATGGPCLYTGRSMKVAHDGLNITKADWDVSVKHLVATLDKFKVPAQEKSEVLAAVSALESDIVQTPPPKR